MRIRLAVLLALLTALAGCGGDPVAVCGECGPTRVAVSGGEVLVAQGRTLRRYSPDGEQRGRTDVLPARRSADIQTLATANGAAWIGTSGAVIRVGPGGEVARATRRPRAYAAAMAGAGGRVWLAAGRRVLRIGPNGAVAARSPRLPARAALAVDGGIVWVAGGDPGYLQALDPVTLRPRGRRIAVGPGPRALAAGDGVVWIACDGGLRRLDVATMRTTRGARLDVGALALGEGGLWALARDDRLHRLDPAAGSATAPPLPLGREASGLTAGAGAVWVALRGAGVARVDPSAMRIAWIREVPVT